MSWFVHQIKSDQKKSVDALDWRSRFDQLPLTPGLVVKEAMRQQRRDVLRPPDLLDPHGEEL